MTRVEKPPAADYKSVVEVDSSVTNEDLFLAIAIVEIAQERPLEQLPQEVARRAGCLWMRRHRAGEGVWL